MERHKLDVGACRCPGRPHPNDWVELSPTVGVGLGMAAYAAIRASNGDTVRLEALLANVYLREGIRAWSFVDADGSSVMVDPSAPDWPDTLDRLLPWDQGGKLVADTADAMYTEGVLRPLGSRTPMQSQGGPMDGLTSATPPSGLRPRKRSRPSSRKPTVAGTPSGAQAP